jgi:toxin ParE1/3/4
MLQTRREGYLDTRGGAGPRRHLGLLAAKNPDAAVKMDELFSDIAARLTTYPTLGRPGRIPCIRELVPHENYLLVYEVAQDTVWILALVHATREWPPIRA